MIRTHHLRKQLTSLLPSQAKAIRVLAHVLIGLVVLGILMWMAVSHG